MKSEKEYIDRVRKNVKRIREKKGLTMEEVADNVDGLEKQHVYRVESSKSQTAPTLKTLIKIASALEVDLMELFKP